MKKLTSLFLLFSISCSLVLVTAFTIGPKKVKSYISKYTWVIKREMSCISEPPSHLSIDSNHYAQQINAIEPLKTQLLNDYNNSNTQETKNNVLATADSLLYSTLLDSIVPYWYGTPWDFNGISRIPQKGNIACGYFVFTVMQDAGFNIPRIGLSQAASESAIKAFVTESNIKRHSNATIEDYVSAIRDWGNGFYLVGLDNHIGMLQVTDEDTWFIHSTVIYPQCVVKEKALTSPALMGSSYRVSGKLSGTSSVTLSWLKGSYFAM